VSDGKGIIAVLNDPCGYGRFFCLYYALDLAKPVGTNCVDEHFESYESFEN
jgi:hypothetical protein